MDNRIATKMPVIKVSRRAESMTRVETSVEGGVKSVKIDADIRKQLADNGVRCARFDEGLRAAVSDQRFAIDDVLISFGVAAKVIVVIEDQDCFVWPCLLYTSPSPRD